MDRKIDGVTSGTFHRSKTCERVVTVGGLTKGELLDRLRAGSIALNRYAELLFASDAFTTSTSEIRVRTVEIEVQHLGFSHGGTFAEILAKARTLGLDFCPLELGPHLRLQYVNQPEGGIGQAAIPHQAPPGVITIVSESLTEDDDFPRGFYLRRIDGVLWLRGYCAPLEHCYSPDDHLLFSEISRVADSAGGERDPAE